MSWSTAITITIAKKIIRSTLICSSSWYDCDLAEEEGIIDDLNRAVNQGNSRRMTLTLLDRFVVSRCYGESDPKTDYGLDFRKKQQELYVKQGRAREDFFDEKKNKTRNLVFIELERLTAISRHCMPANRPVCSVLD